MSGGNAERVGPVSRDEGKGQARHSHLELSTLWDFEFPYPALLVSLRDQWRGVHRGMTKEQIGSVLGPPTRMLEINSKPLWYYEYTFGAGSVAFSQEGLVEDWQRPPLGLFGLW